MKYTLATILAILTLTFSSLGAGITTLQLDGFDKLSESQKAAIVSDVQSKLNANVQSETFEKVDKWVDVGTKVGKGLAGAAKETNIAVNDFAVTPVGILTTALIVWHLMGGALIHVLGGLTVLVIGFITLHVFSKKLREVTIRKMGDGTEVTTVETLSSDAVLGFTIGYIAILITALITVFTF